MAPGRHVPPPPGFPAAAATAHVAGTTGAAINPAAAVLVQITPPGFPPAPPLPLSLLWPLTLCMYNYLPPLLAPTPPPLPLFQFSMMLCHLPFRRLNRFWLNFGNGLLQGGSQTKSRLTIPLSRAGAATLFSRKMDTNSQRTESRTGQEIAEFRHSSAQTTG